MVLRKRGRLLGQPFQNIADLFRSPCPAVRRGDTTCCQFSGDLPERLPSGPKQEDTGEFFGPLLCGLLAFGVRVAGAHSSPSRSQAGPAALPWNGFRPILNGQSGQPV